MRQVDLTGTGRHVRVRDFTHARQPLVERPEVGWGAAISHIGGESAEFAVVGITLIGVRSVVREE